MRWPATFRAERIDVIERLAVRTGYSEEELCKALRGLSIYEVLPFAEGMAGDRLDQRVAEVRTLASK